VQVKSLLDFKDRIETPVELSGAHLAENPSCKTRAERARRRQSTRAEAVDGGAARPGAGGTSVKDDVASVVSGRYKCDGKETRIVTLGISGGR
jgi:hypothetical protein